ncbi:MAG: hypothetical protein ACP5KX_07585 [Caldisericia bacterium]
MNLQEKFNETLDQKLEFIKNELKNGNLDKDLLKDLLKKYDDLKEKILDLIEWAIELKKDDTELKKFYQKFYGYKSSDLLEKLRDLGYALGNDINLKDDFDKQGYRLLEQIRTGQRDIVFYTILRIFISRKKEMPKILLEAFKPIYSDQLFKVFLFSFLSGILGKEVNQ